MWKFFKKLLLIFFLVLGVFFVISLLVYWGYLAPRVDQYLTETLQTLLTQQLKREVSIGQIHLSFPNPQLVISDLAIAREQTLADGTLFEAKELRARLLFRSLFSEQILIDDIVLDSPAIWIEFDEQGRSNLPQFGDGEPKEPSKTSSWFQPQKLVERLVFPHIQLIDTRVHFAHKRVPLTVSVARLNTTLSLVLKSLRVEGKIALDGGVVEYQDRGPLTTAFAGEFDFQDNSLSLSEFQLQAGNSIITLDGALDHLTKPDLNLAVKATVALDDIDEYLRIRQNLSGMVDFTGTVTGEIPDVAVSGRLACERGTAWKFAFAQLQSAVDYESRQIRIADLDVDVWDGHVSANGTLSLDGPPRYTAEVTLDQVEADYVDTLFDQQLQLSGRVSGTGSVRSTSWSFDDLLLDSTLDMQDVLVYGVEIPSGQASLGIQQKTLTINKLQTEIFQGTVRGDGTLDLFDDFLYQARLQAQEIELEPIMALIPTPPDVAGTVSGTVAATGSHFDLPHLALQADLALTNLNAYDIRANSLAVTGRIEEQVLSLETLSAELFGGTVDGAGKLALAGDRMPKFETNLTVEDIAVQRILDQFAARSEAAGIDVTGILDGTVTCEGSSFTLQDVRGNVALQGTGDLLVATGKETEQTTVPFDLTLQGGLAQETVTISDLTVDSSTLQLAATGSMILDEPALDLNYQVASEDLHTLLSQVLVFLPGMDEASPLGQFSGNIDHLRGTVSGPFSDLRIQADARLSQADLLWAMADAVSAQVEYRGSRLSISSLDASHKTARIRASGSLDLSTPSDPGLNIPVVLEAGDLADYLEMAKQDFPLSGNLRQIETALRGTVSQLQTSVPLRINDVVAWDQQVDSISGDVLLAENQVRSSALAIKKNGGTLTLNGGLGFDLTFQASLRANNVDFHDIDVLNNVAVQYEGKMDASLDISGTFDDPQGQARIEFKELSYNGNPTDNAVCDMQFADQKLLLQLTTFQQKFLAKVDLDLTPDLLYQAELSMEQAAVEQILALVMDLEGIGGIITGKISSEGSLRDFRALSASVKLNELTLDIFGQKVTNETPIDLVVTPQKLTVRSLELRGQELGLFVQGFLDFQGNYDLDVDGIVDLRPVLMFLPKSLGVNSLAGRVQLICNVRGTFRDPELVGVAEINQGRVQVDSYPEPVTGINGKLALQKGRIEIVRAEGKVSKGSFIAYGSVAYDGVTPKDFTLDVEARNLVVQDVVPALALTVSPHIRLSGDLIRQKLAGEILVHDALYSQELDLQSLIFSKNRTIALSPEESDAENGGFLMDLFIKAPKNIRFKNKLADMDLRANLRVQGTPVRPQLEGRVEVLRGKIIFGDIRYNIISGIFDFLDPLHLNPDMNIQVETVVQDYDISLGIDGNLTQFSLTMTSDPPLSDGEIARLLAAGSDSTSNGYNFVTKPLQTLVEGRIEKAVKLDRFSVDVDPLLSQTGETEATPTVTLGKRLFKDLLLTFTTTVGGAEASQVVEVEYELSDKMSLSARRDEKGELDTSFTIKFKIK